MNGQSNLHRRPGVGRTDGPCRSPNGRASVASTGAGLFSVKTPEEASEALREVRSNYPRHSAAARQIALEYFDSNKVVGRLMNDIGLGGHRAGRLPSLEFERQFQGSALKPHRRQYVANNTLAVEVPRREFASPALMEIIIFLDRLNCSLSFL